MKIRDWEQHFALDPEDLDLLQHIYDEGPTIPQGLHRGGVALVYGEDTSEQSGWVTDFLYPVSLDDEWDLPRFGDEP